MAEKQSLQDGSPCMRDLMSTFAGQKVKAGCKGKHAPHGVVVLPLNVTSDVATLEKGALAAMEAFGSIQYLVHNAGKQLACTSPVCLGHPSEDVVQARLKAPCGFGISVTYWPS